MTFIEEINKLVEKSIIDKTFSLEVIAQIKKMRDDYIDMEGHIKTSQEINKRLEEENAKIRLENNSLKIREEGIINREKIVTERESKQAMDSLKLENAEKRANEIKEILGIVFKNPIIRSEVYKNTSAPIQSNGYVQNYSGSETEAKTTQQE